MPTSDRPTTLNVACRHPVANHRHGTLVCYNMDLCRCQECTAANRRYERHRKSWAGPFPTTSSALVPVADVRDHVTNLMVQGMGLKRIAQLAGVAASAVGHVVYGRGGSQARPATKMRRATAEKLLAVELDLADGAKIHAGEALQIVGELQLRGWTKAEIGRRVHTPNAVALQIGSNQIMAGTLRALRPLLYEPVPPRVHSPTGQTYNPATHREHQTVEFATPGVPPTPELLQAKREHWLQEMRTGLAEALEASRHRTLTRSTT